jgi:hypothetical protein
MTDDIRDTLNDILWQLKPTTLAAIVADLNNQNLAAWDNDALTMRYVAIKQGVNNVGRDEFEAMVKEAVAYVG